MKPEIAVWDWEREPVPDARVVVVPPEPDRDLGPNAERREGARLGAFIRSGGIAIVSTRGGTGFGSLQHLVHVAHGRAIPALYAERPADLARLPDLLAVKAERLALVLCPREAIDLMSALSIPHPRMVEEDPHAAFLLHEGMRDGTADGPRLIDLVVIIPPPEARTCAACNGNGEVISVYTIGGALHSGGLERCRQCGGKGMVEPWPMHTAWVRGIVEQCRAAGVPVCFLGWGLRRDEDQDRRNRPSGDTTRCRTVLPAGQCWLTADHYAMACVVGHPERMLDGAEVMEIPEWLKQ